MLSCLTKIRKGREGVLVWVENVKNSHRVVELVFNDNKAVKWRLGESKRLHHTWEEHSRLKEPQKALKEECNLAYLKDSKDIRCSRR